MGRLSSPPKSYCLVKFGYLLVLMWVAQLFSGSTCSASSECGFEAIFNFGDSNSDTGGFWAAFPAQSGPFGVTYFNKPAGRASDGRLVIDFLAQAFGYPMLSPYLQSIGSDYRHGANFGTLASTVLLPQSSLFVSGLSPFSLAIQLNQMKQFKLLSLHSSPKTGSSNLPPPNVFGKSLYTFYIGQNDFTSNLGNGIDAVKQSLPEVVSQIASTIKEVYGLGGRAFLVQNLAPVGCYPSLLAGLPHKRSDMDEFGCVASINNAVSYYNNMLKEALSQTRAALPNASLIYVDTFSVLLHLFRHPTSHGLKYGTKACCGHGGGEYNFDPKLYCGNTKVLSNGSKASATACRDPDKYVSWDGIHTTEAANKIVAMAILNGSYSHPPFPFHQLCHLHPIA